MFTASLTRHPLPFCNTAIRILHNSSSAEGWGLARETYLPTVCVVCVWRWDYCTLAQSNTSNASSSLYDFIL